MNRKFILLMIGVWSIIAIVFGIILVTGIKEKPAQNFKFNFKAREQQVKEAKSSMQGINKVKIIAKSEDIIIHETAEEMLRMVATTDEENTVELLEDGDTIIIEGSKEPIQIQFGMVQNEKIDIYLPKNYNKSLEIVSTSGDVEIQNALTLEQFDCKQTSGDIEVLESMEINSIKINSTSGDVEFNRPVRTKEITVHSTSGTLNMQEINTNQYDLSTTSGDLRIGSLVGQGSIGSSSGDIGVSIESLDGIVDVSSSSGSINLNLKDNLNRYLEASTSSGDIDGNVAFNYSKDGKEAFAGDENSINKIKVQTSSGDITINVTD